MASEYEERAKKAPEPAAAQLREEAKLYREEIVALKTGFGESRRRMEDN